jgi:phosphorylated CTD-interacting factor 1
MKRGKDSKNEKVYTIQEKDFILCLCEEIENDLIKYSNSMYTKKIKPLYNKGKVYTIQEYNYPLIEIKDSLYDDNKKIISWNTKNKTITNTHYLKLKALFRSYIFYHQNHDLSYSDSAFHYHLFVLLDQYDNMFHSGYQASIPVKLAHYLQYELDVSTEMFASPMNCLYPSFYSAYPITDKYFTSKGSVLYDFQNIEQGSFESNPPYTEDFMLLNAYMITHILQKSDKNKKKKPLSFVIINPNWKDTPSFYALTKSKYNCLKNKYLNIPASNHTYMSGSQYKLNNVYYKSSVGSFVFILQNYAGAKKWPITDKIIRNIIKHFK